jgi:hypothetical protein
MRSVAEGADFSGRRCTLGSFTMAGKYYYLNFLMPLVFLFNLENCCVYSALGFAGQVVDAFIFVQAVSMFGYAYSTLKKYN